MADEFVYGLAAGLVIIAIMLLAFSTNWNVGYGYAGSTGSTWFASNSPQPELITAELGNPYQVGKIVESDASEIDLGELDISGTPNTEELQSGIVQSGIFFGEKSLHYMVENPESIHFSVLRTNGYGPLLVKANGNVVYELKPGITDEITVPLHMEGPVELELVVPSSGWKMWAPALYELNEVDVQTQRKSAEYIFSTGEDFVNGELQFDSYSGAGYIKVDINGVQVWNGYVGDSKIVPFYSAEDVNRLTVTATGSSGFDGDLMLRLFREHTENKTFETVFNLTAGQRGKLPGHIVFEVPTVRYGGSIVVKLIVGDQTKLAESIDAEAKTHAVAFFPSNIVPDQATRLVIEAGDGAQFYIRNVKVWV